MTKLDLASLLEKVNLNKQQLKTIKDESLKKLIEVIIKTKTTNKIIKELSK